MRGQHTCITVCVCLYLLGKWDIHGCIDHTDHLLGSTNFCHQSFAVLSSPRTLVFDTHLALQADPGKRKLQNLLCSLYYAYIIFLCKKNEPRSYIDQAG